MGGIALGLRFRSKRRALTRARKLLQDGDEETERLSAMTDTLNVERERVLCRIEEFRVRKNRMEDPVEHDQRATSGIERSP